MISHRGTIYSKKFNVSLVVLTVLTSMVMTVIGNNVALSLGMVGALSIVRFRTAIKDSRDTVYIFWTIIVGICCGVGDFVVAGIGSAFVFILFLILGAIKNNNRMLVIIRGNRTKEAQIQAIMYKFFGAKAVLRVKNSTTESIEFIYEITAKLLSQAERKNNIGICDEIYKIGGAQAIAAMAYGTDCVPKVDKITGPGNIFVALAKKAVYGHVSIDSVAGPSEILVLADESANPRYVAADLLSQAEHDELASAILITTSKELAEQVSKEVDAFTEELSRKEIIQKSLDNYGYILLAEKMEDAIDAANEIASEHLEILTKNPFDTMTRIKNAGAIFLGEYSSEPLGDYFAGPNHILPTNGTAKFFSPLNVDDFMKKTSIISYSREALEKVHKDIEAFAESEGLTAHANSVKVRFERS